MMLDRTPAWDYKLKEKWFSGMIVMRACLLHGEECKVWKGSNLIASGQLGFCGLRGFTMKDRAGNFRLFWCSEEHFMSGKYRIKKLKLGNDCVETVTDGDSYEVVPHI